MEEDKRLISLPPPGFVLDKPKQAPVPSLPPPGFVLDERVLAPPPVDPTAELDKSKSVEEEILKSMSPQPIPEPAAVPKERPRWPEELPGTIKETLIDMLKKRVEREARLFQPEFWKSIPKNFLSGAWDFVRGMTHAIIPAPVEGEPTPYMVEEARITGKPVKDIWEIVKAGAAPVAGLATFLPRTAWEFAKNPVKMLEENPFDTLLLLGVIAGPKIKARIKTRGVIKGSEIHSLIKEIPENVLPSEIKLEVVKKIPAEKNFYPFIPKDAPQIWRDIVDRGGIKRPKFEIEEFEAGVPKVLRRKTGMKPDDMAARLELEGMGELYEAIEWKKRPVTEAEYYEQRAGMFEPVKEPAIPKPTSEAKIRAMVEQKSVKEIAELKKGKLPEEVAILDKIIAEKTAKVEKPREVVREEAEIIGIEERPLSEAELRRAKEAGLVEEAPPTEKRPVSFEEELKAEEPISMLKKKEMERAEEAGYIKVEVDKTFGGSVKTKAYQNIFDRFHSIKKLTDIVKKEGVELPAVKDPYMGIRNYLGVQGKAETKIFYKRFKVDEQGNVRFKGESLKDILKPVKGELDNFRRYLVDRRVPELEGRGIKTGRNVVEAKKFIKEHIREFEPHAKKFTEYMHSLLDELYEAGYLEKSKLETIKSHNQMYAPFQRVIKDIEQHGYIPSSRKILSKITSPLKRIKGSERPIIDPLESAIEATYRITNVIERNRIANQIIDLREMSPEIARIIKPTKPQMSVTVLEDGTKVYRPSVYQQEGIIQVFQKGKRHFYEVPKELYDAMSQLDKVGYGWMTKILAAPARLLRTGATTVPEFAFRNPVRDQWFAFVNAKYGYIPGYDFAKGLFTLIKKPELYWKWKATGGEWSMLVTLDRASNQISLKKVLGVKDYKKYMKNPIGFFEDVSMVGEMPTRLGVFERAQRKISDIEAAFESREGSIDFARRGAKTKTISALYTFLNARLQGMEKLIRTAKERPVETTAKIMAVAVIPSFINYLMNRDDPYYWEIPEWQRDLFWIIPIRRAKGVMGKKPIYIRIPKGDVGVIFGTSTEKILESMDKSREGRVELDKLAISIIKESMPISDMGGFLPVAARIPVELMANEKFFYGRPIVSRGKEKLEPRYQYSPFTSETAKAIGDVFNISAPKIEHLITGYGAGMARYALKLNDGILGEMGVLPKKPERPKELADIPVVSAFTIRDPRGFGSESVQKFYDAIDAQERFSITDKKLRQEGKKQERIKYIKDHKLEFIVTRRGLDTEFRRVRGDLAALRKIRDRVLDSKEMTKEKKEEITNEINALVMAQVITVLSKYRALEKMVK